MFSYIATGRSLRLGATTAGLAAGLLLGAQAQAHGSMEVPVSRVYNCFLEGPENPISDACRAAVGVSGPQGLYDWNGINQLPNGNHQAFVPDGQLCSAGKPSHAGLDLPRGDWPATSISPDANGRFEFIYRATAPHSTQSMSFYVTRDGWDPGQPLTWGTLEPTPFCELDAVFLDNGRYRMDCPLPAGKSGRHVIYNIWQRNDSAEAFYACVDVVFAAPGAVDWRPLGQVRAFSDLPAGSSVTFRLFDVFGGDAGSHSVSLVEDTPADLWVLELAEQVNLESTIVRIGVLGQNGQIAPVALSQGNTAYSQSPIDYTFAIDITQPPPGGGGSGGGGSGGGSAGTWDADAIYVLNDQVVIDGTTYTAKWWTRGFAPDTPVDNPWDSPWSPEVLKTGSGGTGGSGGTEWQADAAYVAGSVVTHLGLTYEAKWWSKGFAPDTPVANTWESPWARR